MTQFEINYIVRKLQAMDLGKRRADLRQLLEALPDDMLTDIVMLAGQVTTLRKRGLAGAQPDLFPSRYHINLEV